MAVSSMWKYKSTSTLKSPKHNSFKASSISLYEINLVNLSKQFMKNITTYNKYHNVKVFNKQNMKFYNLCKFCPFFSKFDREQTWKKISFIYLS